MSFQRLTEEVSTQPIPRTNRSTNLIDVFLLRRWVGVPVASVLFYVAIAFNLLIGTLVLIYTVRRGGAYIALGILLGPCYFLLFSFLTRVVYEVILSVLLLPHVIKQQQQQAHQQPTPTVVGGVDVSEI